MSEYVHEARGDSQCAASCLRGPSIQRLDHRLGKRIRCEIRRNLHAGIVPRLFNKTLAGRTGDVAAVHRPDVCDSRLSRRGIREYDNPGPEQDVRQIAVGDVTDRFLDVGVVCLLEGSVSIAFRSRDMQCDGRPLGTDLGESLEEPFDALVRFDSTEEQEVEATRALFVRPFPTVLRGEVQ